MPRQVLESRKAQVSLRIIIVGGHVGGLAAAYTLQRAGHDVVVLEQGDGKEKHLGILPSPPNMTRVLMRWGLTPQLNKVATIVNQFSFMTGETGEPIGLLKFEEELLRDLLANFVFMQHGDLTSMLLDIARREGVEIRYNSTVTQITSSPPSVVLANGETLYSDIIVGADGQGSITREAVVLKELEVSPTNQLCLTFSLPTELMRADEELRDLTELPHWWLWLGNSYLVHGSLVDAKQRYGVLISYEIDEDLSEYRDNWTKRYPPEHFNLHNDRFEPRVQKLLQMAKTVIPTSYLKRPPLDSLVCDDSKIVLVGEAAHPSMPTGIHQTAMCIEDAEVIGNLFSRIENVDELPRVLAAYEELRLHQCSAAKEWEWRKVQMLTVPKGPDQELRDYKIRSGAENDDVAFREIWGEEVDFYAYDAAEQADDWWTKWGSGVSRQANRTSLLSQTPTVEISISNH